jgi:hypothetical protein
LVWMIRVIQLEASLAMWLIQQIKQSARDSERLLYRQCTTTGQLPLASYSSLWTLSRQIVVRIRVVYLKLALNLKFPRNQCLDMRKIRSYPQTYTNPGPLQPATLE